MGWLASVAEAAVSAVSKVAEVATGGAIGKMIAGALERFGLPKEICGIIACIGDPSYSTKFLCEELDRVGKALGLPEELTGALKKIVQNAEKYAQAFAKGGFGAVVCEVGKDLGLPPELYLAVAAGIDAYTGNAAGAAANLMKLAAQCAKHLGIPESAVNIVEFAGAAYSGDVKGMTNAGMEIGMDLVDNMGGVPEELKSMMHVAVDSYRGDNKAVQEHMLQFAAQVGERVGLPPEMMGTLKVAVAYAQDDQKAMEAALKEVGNDLVGRLPPELQGPARMAVAQVAKDPAKALEALKNLPEAAREGVELLTAAAKDPENLKKAADLGIKQLPPELQGPVRGAVNAFINDPKAAMESLKTLPARAQDEFYKALDNAKNPENLKKAADLGIKHLPPELQGPVRGAVNAYINDPKAALESLKTLPARVQDEFYKVLDNAKDPEKVKTLAKKHIDKAVSTLPLETRRAYNLALHVATGDTKAVKEDLNQFTTDVRKNLPPKALETLTLVGQIADGDTTALKKELDKVKNQTIQAMADRYQPPMRA